MVLVGQVSWLPDRPRASPSQAEAQWFFSPLSPVTVAGPRRHRTGFPIRPNISGGAPPRDKPWRGNHTKGALAHTGTPQRHVGRSPRRVNNSFRGTCGSGSIGPGLVVTLSTPVADPVASVRPAVLIGLLRAQSRMSAPAKTPSSPSCPAPSSTNGTRPDKASAKEEWGRSSSPTTAAPTRWWR